MDNFTCHKNLICNFFELPSNVDHHLICLNSFLSFLLINEERIVVLMLLLFVDIFFFVATFIGWLVYH